MVQLLRFSLPVAAFAAAFLFQSAAFAPEALAQDRRLASIPSTPIVANDRVNGSVSGTVYHDANGNHFQDVGETGFAYATMLCHTLNGAGAVTSTIVGTTNIDGNYTFSGLAAGRYRLECESKELQQNAASSATFDITGEAPNVIGTFGASDEINPAIKAGIRLPGGTSGRIRDPLMK